MRKNGFTLMELLLAIAIMGLMATVGFAVYTASLSRSRDAQRKGNLNAVGKALESYISDKGAYPGSCEGKIVGCDGVVCEWGESLENSGKVYIGQLPEDPLQGQNFVYAVRPDQRSYQIFARLEFEEDKQVNPDGYTLICTTDNRECNYGISSSNTTLSVTLDTDTDCP